MEKNYLDSSAYRRLFEYIKENGSGEVKKFVLDYSKYKNEDFLSKAIYYDAHITLEFARRNKKFLEYIRNNLSDAASLNIKSDEFFRLMLVTTDIDKALQNARRLEELKITKVTLCNDIYYQGHRMQIFTNDSGKVDKIRKFYTDGEFSYALGDYNVPRYEEYYLLPRRNIKSKFILEVCNGIEEIDYRHIELVDFGFDVNALPSEEELCKNDAPYEFKLKRN